MRREMRSGELGSGHGSDGRIRGPQEGKRAQPVEDQADKEAVRGRKLARDFGGGKDSVGMAGQDMWE